MSALNRPAACALLAAACVAALELPLRRAAGAVRPIVFQAPTFSRDVWANENALRRCAQKGQALVLFTGGSPTSDLDRERLYNELAPLGAVPCLVPFPGGLRPPELQAYLPTLLALKPRLLVLHVGQQTFSAYDQGLVSRLAYFQPGRALPFLAPRQSWALRGLVARSWAARASIAFRYRHVLRSAIWPERYMNSDPVNRQYQDLRSGRPDVFAIRRGVQLWMYDDFLARWRRTGIPILVWDSPRAKGREVPGPLAPPNRIRAYLQLAASASARGGAPFIGPEYLPDFPDEEFHNKTHLTKEGGRRLTAALLPYVKAALAGDPIPAPARRGGTPRGTAEGKPTARTGRRTGR